MTFAGSTTTYYADVDVTVNGPTLSVMKTGNKIGKWRLGKKIRIESGTKNGHPRFRAAFRCTCECGTKKVVFEENLARSSKSCGCNRSPSGEDNPNYKHGQSGTPEYNAWGSMWKRCTNQKDKHHKKYYIDRGITVDLRWKSFEIFLSDMGPRPGPGHSLERKNNELGYGPRNCVWATQTEQARNHRNTRWLEIDGVRKPLRTWVEESGLPFSAVEQRIRLLGWDPKRALTTPLQPPRFKIRGSHG